MNIDDMILVSIDDHVVEPPDMFRPRAGEVGPRRRSSSPTTRASTSGCTGPAAGRQRPQRGGLVAAEEWGRDPAGFAEMRPGVYDIHERVRDMDRNGILASMCFPTFAGFTARHLNSREDVTVVMVQAYNDWHIDEWAGAYPGRFIPSR